MFLLEVDLFVTWRQLFRASESYCSEATPLHPCTDPQNLHSGITICENQFARNDAYHLESIDVVNSSAWGFEGPGLLLDFFLWFPVPWIPSCFIQETFLEPSICSTIILSIPAWCAFEWVRVHVPPNESDASRPSDTLRMQYECNTLKKNLKATLKESFKTKKQCDWDAFKIKIVCNLFEFDLFGPDQWPSDQPALVQWCRWCWRQPLTRLCNGTTAPALENLSASTYEQLGFDQQCDCPQPPTLMSSIVFNYTGHTSNFICWDVSSSWSFKAKALRKPAFLWPIRPFQHIRQLLRRFVYKIVRILGSIRPYRVISSSMKTCSNEHEIHRVQKQTALQTWYTWYILIL